MNNPDVSSRFDGHTNGASDDDSTLFHEGGVLPKDFPERLERLKQASGLSWGALARAIGVDRKSLMRWRNKGVEPCGERCTPSSASRPRCPAVWRSSLARASR